MYLSNVSNQVLVPEKSVRLVVPEKYEWPCDPDRDAR